MFKQYIGRWCFWSMSVDAIPKWYRLIDHDGSALIFETVDGDHTVIVIKESDELALKPESIHVVRNGLGKYHFTFLPEDVAAKIVDLALDELDARLK
jgi:hypothetical protein